MTCKNCGEEARYEVVEETSQGYVWESECTQCGEVVTGYEF